MKNDNVFIQIGASNHSNKTREKNDFYSTDPKAVEALLKNYSFEGKILEPCCGSGCISIPLQQAGYKVVSTDLYDHGYGVTGVDFFEMEEIPKGCVNIITNPPYKFVNEFIIKALQMLLVGGVLACFLKTQYLEGIDRYERIYKDNPPFLILQFINRVSCKENCKIGDDFGPSAVAYAWYIWVKGYKGDTRIKWIYKN